MCINNTKYMQTHIGNLVARKSLLLNSFSHTPELVRHFLTEENGARLFPLAPSSKARGNGLSRNMKFHLNMRNNLFNV